MFCISSPSPKRDGARLRRGSSDTVADLPQTALDVLSSMQQDLDARRNQMEESLRLVQTQVEAIKQEQCLLDCVTCGMVESLPLGEMALFVSMAFIAFALHIYLLLPIGLVGMVLYHYRDQGSPTSAGQHNAAASLTELKSKTRALAQSIDALAGRDAAPTLATNNKLLVMEWMQVWEEERKHAELLLLDALVKCKRQHHAPHAAFWPVRVATPQHRNDFAPIELQFAEENLVQFPPESSLTWRECVAILLPLERATRMTFAEHALSNRLRTSTRGKWDELPFDIKLMLLRKLCHSMDALTGQVLYISSWRKYVKANDMLSSQYVMNAEEERFLKSGWPCSLAGQDYFGHPIVYQDFAKLDLDFLFALTSNQVLYFRTKHLEILRRIKLECSKNNRKRVCKHVQILNLAQFALHRQVTKSNLNLLRQVFHLESVAYPDSVWSLWLVNAPIAFKLVWAALESEIDFADRAKIHLIHGGSDNGLEEMVRCGIPLDAVPREIGGEYEPCLEFWDVLRRSSSSSMIGGALSSKTT